MFVCHTRWWLANNNVNTRDLSVYACYMKRVTTFLPSEGMVRSHCIENFDNCLIYCWTLSFLYKSGFQVGVFTNRESGQASKAYHLSKNWKHLLSTVTLLSPLPIVSLIFFICNELHLRIQIVQQTQKFSLPYSLNENKNVSKFVIDFNEQSFLRNLH